MREQTGYFRSRHLRWDYEISDRINNSGRKIFSGRYLRASPDIAPSINSLAYLANTKISDNSPPARIRVSVQAQKEARRARQAPIKPIRQKCPA
jgi:hypothetical protein